MKNTRSYSQTAALGLGTRAVISITALLLVAMRRNLLLGQSILLDPASRTLIGSIATPI